MANDQQSPAHTSDGGSRPLDRRALLAGGAAIAGAAVAKLSDPETASAAHDGSVDQTVLHVDATNTGAGSTRVSSNISGTAAFVALNNYPVGISRPDGMLGRTTYTTSNAAGVAGANEAASGGIGVLGTAKSSTGTGVYGFSGSVVPSEVAPGGTGVYGKGPSRGVLGRSSGGPGVQGESPVTSTGVYGFAGTGAPTEAAPEGTGVFGRGPNLGVLGRATAGAGVQGETTSGNGVRGSSSGGATGVRGDASGGSGGTGVLGASAAGVGVRGSTTSGVALLGTAGATGLAGRFVGRTVVEGAFEVTGPNTTLVQPPAGSAQRVYSPGCPEPWFEDFGEARLKNGRATVRLDKAFDALVDGRRYLVQLTEYGNLGGLYVVRRRANLFQVRSRRRGANGRFGYRVVAKRADLAL